ncbi:MAG: DUF4395 domain-containing protein [Pseudoclavibacter sp.]
MRERPRGRSDPGYESEPRRSRGPRYVGGYTFVLSVVVLLIALVRPLESSAIARVLSPEFILLFVLWISFAAGTFFGNQAHPFAVVFKHVIRPRLKAKPRFDDKRPHRFALLVGFVLSGVGLVLHLAGVHYGLAILTALLIIASFLQAFVGLCLGCRVYLLLVRSGLIHPTTPIAG